MTGDMTYKSKLRDWFQSFYRNNVNIGNLALCLCTICLIWTEPAMVCWKNTVFSAHDLPVFHTLENAKRVSWMFCWLSCTPSRTPSPTVDTRPLFVGDDPREKWTNSPAAESSKAISALNLVGLRIAGFFAKNQKSQKLTKWQKNLREWWKMRRNKKI